MQALTEDIPAPVEGPSALETELLVLVEDQEVELLPDTVLEDVVLSAEEVHLVQVGHDIQGHHLTVRVHADHEVQLTED